MCILTYRQEFILFKNLKKMLSFYKLKSTLKNLLKNGQIFTLPYYILNIHYHILQGYQGNLTLITLTYRQSLVISL